MATKFTKARCKELEDISNGVLAEMRPFFNEDGGDITLESVTPEGIVQVKLHGACENCSMSAMTLRAGVIDSIKKIAPEIQGLEVINKS